MKNEQQNCMQTRKTNKVIINLAKKIKKSTSYLFYFKNPCYDKHDGRCRNTQQTKPSIKKQSSSSPATPID